MPTIRSLRSLHTGFCTHPGCMALKGAGLASQCFPSQVFVIETLRGVVLFDTGYASHFEDATQGVYSLYKKVTPVFHQEQESAVHQLKSLGISQRDVKAIILSHYHGDHIAGLKDFPYSNVITCAQAFEHHKSLTGLRALKEGFLPALLPHDIEQRIQPIQSMPHTTMQISDSIALPLYITPFTGIYIIPLPGHAKGHIGAILKSHQGYTLLAGDAAWRKQSYTDLIGPSALSFLIQDNKAQYYQSLQLLHTLHNAHVKIMLTHDPS